MPKDTKDVEIEEKKAVKKKTTTKPKTDSKVKTTSTAKSKTASKKSTTKTEVKEEVKKSGKKTSTSTSAKSKNTKKTDAVEKVKTKSTKKSVSTTSKKVESKSATKKATSTSNAKTTKKVSATKKSTSTTKSRIKKLEPNIVAEYYDLPYRYNETIVKILYQTPTILFVYWDISDLDRENYIKKYGEHFFYNTKPILKIFNLTKNYSFEVEINDFANSWYIHLEDSNCEYKVELSRRTIKYEENLNTDYIYISTSNDIEFPNDHILLNELPDIVNFKNVKTNVITKKNISTMHLIGINKIYNVKDFYNAFYKDEIIEELNSNKIIIPSSSSWGQI